MRKLSKDELMQISGGGNDKDTTTAVAVTSAVIGAAVAGPVGAVVGPVIAVAIIAIFGKKKN